jgi:hypothetical protein
MGYYSRARGEINFSPELPRYATRGNEIIVKYVNNADYDVFLDPDWCTITAPEDSFKAYWIVDNLKELVAAILKVNPDTTFSGYIEIEGEGDGSGEPDLWRLRIKDGKVEEVRPKLVWPED